MKISNYLGTSPENLPFLDVDLDKDNLLFIDPRAIRIASLRGDFNSSEYAKMLSNPWILSLISSQKQY